MESGTSHTSLVPFYCQVTAQLQFVCFPHFWGCSQSVSFFWLSRKGARWLSRWREHHRAHFNANIYSHFLCCRFFFFFQTECNKRACNCVVFSFSFICALFLFSFSRQQLLKAQFDSPPISPKTPASAVKCKTPKERGQRCNNSVLSQFFQKKPKTPSSKETQCNGSISECVQEGKKWTAGIHNDTDLHSGKAELSVVVKEEPIDMDDASTQGSTSLTAFPSISAENGMAHSLTPSKDIKPIIKGKSSLTVNILWLLPLKLLL